MNEQRMRRGHGGRIVLIVIFVLLALICAAPFLYNALSHFEYDDYETLAAANEEKMSLSADADGEHLLFSMDKADVYSLLLEDGTIDGVRDALDGRAALEKIGYTLSLEQAQVRMALKILGFIPVQLQANAAVGVEGSAVRGQLTDIQIGPWIKLTAEKAAELAGIEALTEPFEFSLTEYTEPLRADRVRIGDDGMTISSALLAQVIDEVAGQDDPRVRLLRLYYGDTAAAAMSVLDGRGRADFIRESGASFAALRAALRDVAALGCDAYRRGLQEALSALPVDLTSGMDSCPELREAQSELLAQAQKTYRDAQLDLRRAYWYKEVMLTQGRLTEMDGTPLEARCPSAWEARVVLQYNEAYDAIVKTNEGNPRLQVPIPGLPMMSELKRDSRASLPAEGDGPFDLTLALRLPSGVPAVVFLTAEDEYGLAVIPEALFREVSENERTPVLSSAAVCTQPRDRWLRLTGLGGDLPAGNYIGLN